MPDARPFAFGFLLFLLASSLTAARGQTLEIAGGGGYGVLFSENTDRSGVGGPALSFAGPADSKHKVQFDYFFGNVSSFSFDSHFLTASYVWQGRAPGVRPFFQVGAGVEVQKFERPPFGGPGSFFRSSQTNFALLLGGGASIDVSDHLFVRPELRSYSVVGPAIFLVPMLIVGWRF
jgi:opacity protein-like surface antigen